MISPLVDSGPPEKYSYEIGQSFVDPLTIHSLDPLIGSSRTKKVGFVFRFLSGII